MNINFSKGKSGRQEGHSCNIKIRGSGEQAGNNMELGWFQRISKEIKKF